MPTIELSERTFTGLQRLAKPFVDTPDDVIWRLVQAALEGSDEPDTVVEPTPTRTTRPMASVPTEAMPVDPFHPEDLTHTRIIRAVVDGVEVDRPNWNGLVQLTHMKALRRLGSLEALKRISRSNMRPGRYEERGYVYVPEVDVSIQGVEARLAWENTARVVRELGMPIEVEFEWYDKDKAAHPGRMAIMAWKPAEE